MADLAHVVHGPRDGLPVVLLHGFPYDHRMWRTQVGPLIGNGHRVVLPDLAGHGQTDPLPDATIDSMADDVVRLLDRLHLAKAAIAGFSMGGYVALSLAVRHPGRVSALALLDTRAGADSEEGKAQRDATLADVAAHGTRALVAAMLPKQFTDATRSQHRLLVEEVRDLMLGQPKDGVLSAVRALRDRPDRTADLPAIAVPTLVLVGDQDPVTPPAEAQAMAAAIAGAKLVVVPGAAHCSPLEQSSAVNEALLDWLETVPR